MACLNKKWAELINNILLANHDKNCICTEVILNLRKIFQSYFWRQRFLRIENVLDSGNVNPGPYFLNRNMWSHSLWKICELRDLDKK